MASCEKGGERRTKMFIPRCNNARHYYIPHIESVLDKGFLQIFSGLLHKLILLLPLSLFLVIFLFVVPKAFPGYADHVVPFNATLTIKMPNCDASKSVELILGFNIEQEAWPAPPPGPDPNWCFDAYFDNEETMLQDGNSIVFQFPDISPHFIKAILPAGSNTISENWSAVWGLKVFTNPLLYDQNNLSIELRWDPNELIPGEFDLILPDEKRVDLLKDATVFLTALPNGSLISIEYKPKERLALSYIILVGGGQNELNGSGYEEEFSYLGEMVFKEAAIVNGMIKDHLPSPYSVMDDVKFIFYRPFYPLNGGRENIVYAAGALTQKAALRELIRLISNRWIRRKTENAFLVIYLVDHGILDPNHIDKGEVFIDPNHTDDYARHLTGRELDEMLSELESDVNQNNVHNYEIIVMAESSYSRLFVEGLFNPNFPDDERESRRILVASADSNQKALVSDRGKAAFSYYFWNELHRSRHVLWESFQTALCNFRDGNRTDQVPYFCYNNTCFGENYVHCDNPGDGEGFSYDDILNVFVPEAYMPGIPEITRVEVENHRLNLSPFDIFRTDITVYGNTNLQEAWALIYYEDCFDEECMVYCDPNESFCNGNICTFSPNYNFYLTDTRAKVYVRGLNNQASLPYDISDSLRIEDIPEDDYEQDYHIEPIDLSIEKYQINSFHEPNDIDLIYYYEESEHVISLAIPSPLPLKQDIVPFNMKAFLSYGKRIDLSPLTYDSNVRYGDINIFYARVYQYPPLEGGGLVCLKITPSDSNRHRFPYILYRKSTTVESQHSIFGEVNMHYYQKIKNNLIDSPYLIDCKNKKIDMHWIRQKEDSKYKPAYFYFNYDNSNCCYTIPDCCFRFYMDVNYRGDICPDTNYIMINTNLFRPDEIFIENLDLDCDGITDLEEQSIGTDTNTAEIILHPELNLFRYPFWAEYYVDGVWRCGIDLDAKLYDEGSIDPNIIDSIKRIMIYSYPNRRSCDTNYSFYDTNDPNSHILHQALHDYNRNSEGEKLLINQYGALVYFDFDPNIFGYTLLIPKPAYDTYEDSGIDPNIHIFRLFPNFVDSNKTAYINPNTFDLVIRLSEKPGNSFAYRIIDGSEITLFSGLNIKALIGFYNNLIGYRLLTYKGVIPSEQGLEIGTGFTSSHLDRSLRDLLNSQAGPALTTMMRYDDKKGKWQGKYPFFGNVSGENFGLKTEEAYLFYLKGKQGNERRWLPTVY